MGIILGILYLLGKVIIPAAAFTKVVSTTIAAGNLVNESLKLATKARTKAAIAKVIKLEHRAESRLANIATVAAKYKKKPPFKGFTFDFQTYAKSLEKEIAIKE